MDYLSASLQHVDIHGSVFCYGPVSGAWGFEGGAPGRCLFHALVEGEAWVHTGGAPRRMVAGDVLLLPRGGMHRLTGHPAARTVPLASAVRRDPSDAFARLDFIGDGSDAWLICGSFRVDDLDRHPLLSELPDVLLINAGLGRWLRETLTALSHHLERAVPGSALIANRLAEVLFIQLVATWLQTVEKPRRWVRAVRDPHVGRALGLIHGAPGQPWSATSLARAVGVSRSALFARFKHLLGETPIATLTAWRMTLAARELQRSEASIAEVSVRAGYRSVPSFTRAFRRHHGLTPGAYRRARQITRPVSPSPVQTSNV